MNNFSNIVVSSRIRFARNLSGYFFPNKLNDFKVANEITSKVFSILNSLGGYECLKLKDLSRSKILSLMENHLISPLLAENENFGAVAINADDRISIMINEEDHIREQCIVDGLNLEEAFEVLNRVDNEIINNLEVCCNEEDGFLTACPLNMGTGLRASVMLFLPALTLSGNMKNIIEMLKNSNLTVRGIYGEGSEAKGYLYQISNKLTLGLSEKQIIENVKNAVTKVCQKEILARSNYKQTDLTDLKDRVFRDFGILTNCYKISSEEAFMLLSELKLGEALGVIELKSVEKLNELISEIQPNIMNVIANKPMNEFERDVFRANYLAKEIKNLRR